MYVEVLTSMRMQFVICM